MGVHAAPAQFLEALIQSMRFSAIRININNIRDIIGIPMDFTANSRAESSRSKKKIERFIPPTQDERGKTVSLYANVIDHAENAEDEEDEDWETEDDQGSDSVGDEAGDSD
ncbi:hypothetical protein I302_103215 [Kwoniella bestiolae CBS 10118]|uniref:Uncharacterized protein n=1 Tax=Kwoniella bestiolae CBS 10118 TaxID=1296100 RepID=A0A1B9G7S5_9TREE|nr:hypothetical protein I302_01914 [Kwoniella bestiolae CBS 10118]OCF27079.1 hypothetical protein I302_01914 [Kwoniella bestiolae CBS 10118]